MFSLCNTMHVFIISSWLLRQTEDKESLFFFCVSIWVWAEKWGILKDCQFSHSPDRKRQQAFLWLTHLTIILPSCSLWLSPVKLLFLFLKVTATVDKITQITLIKLEFSLSFCFTQETNTSFPCCFYTNLTPECVLGSHTHTCAHSLIPFLSEVSSRKLQKGD